MTYLGVGAFFAAILLLFLLDSLSKNLNHDEHQFAAPGVLLAREGLLPYRDYPLFHLPNLVFVYAGLNLLNDQPFLIARMFAVACALALVWLCFSSSKSLTQNHLRLPVGLSILVVVLLVFDPLFAFTTGRIWNHNLPALLIVAAFLLLMKASQSAATSFLIGSAVCAGLAAGTRLTYAPILIPLWASIWLFPVSLQRRSLLAAIYFSVTTLTLGPTFYFLLADREAFLFGNFEFPRLRLLDPTDERAAKTINPLRKLRFFFKEVLLPSAPLVIPFLIYTARPVWSWLRNRPRTINGPVLIWGMLLFGLIGCFTPSRYQYQHFFVVIPLMVMGLALGISQLAGSPNRRTTWGMLTTCALASLGLALYHKTYALRFNPEDWFPARMHRAATLLRSHVPAGPCLTLAPAYVHESGRQIYPEFATSPFAWRGASLVAAERRDSLKIVAPEDLESFLTKTPPAAILTGVESAKLEQPLKNYALAHKYIRKTIQKRTLWLPPSQFPANE